MNTPQIYADLTVTSLSSNASSYDAGDTITITATVKNQGVRGAGGFIILCVADVLRSLNTEQICLFAGRGQFNDRDFYLYRTGIYIHESRDRNGKATIPEVRPSASWRCPI